MVRKRAKYVEMGRKRWANVDRSPKSTVDPPPMDSSITTTEERVASNEEPSIGKSKRHQDAAAVHHQKRASKKKRGAQIAEKRRLRLEAEKDDEEEEEVVEVTKDQVISVANMPPNDEADASPPKRTRKPPDTTITDPALMSERTRRRRRAEIRKALKLFFPPGSRITSSPETGLSEDDCVELLAKTDVTVSFLRILRKFGLVPSITKVYERKHELLSTLPSMDMILVGKEGQEVHATCMSLLETLTHALQKPAVLDQLPDGPIKVTLTGDAGGSGEKLSTKFCVYFNDVADAISVNNLMLLASFPATDSRSFLEDLFASYVDEFRQLKTGIQTARGLRQVQLFLVVDLKTLSTVIGHQGASATYFCQFCDATDAESQAGMIGKLRTLESIRIAGKRIEEMGLQHSAKAKRANKSIFGKPLIEEDIVLVPPVMHVMGGVLNSIVFDRIQEKCKLDERFRIHWNAVCKLHNVAIQYPAQAFLFKDASFLAHSIVDKNLTWVPHFAHLQAAVALLPYCKAEYYADKKIDEFERAVNYFFEELGKDDTAKTIPKAHILQHHVIPFFREHKSWSKFSEQSIEGLHKIFNAVARKQPGKTQRVKAKVSKTFTERQLLRRHFL